MNDWITGGRPSSADLRSAVGINYGGNDAGAKNESAAETLIEHGQAGRERADSMHGTDPDGTKIKDETHQKKEFVNDYTDSHTGHAVHEVTTWNKDHSETHLVQDKTTGVEQLTNSTRTARPHRPITIPSPALLRCLRTMARQNRESLSSIMTRTATSVCWAAPSWAHELPSSTADRPALRAPAAQRAVQRRSEGTASGQYHDQ